MQRVPGKGGRAGPGRLGLDVPPGTATPPRPALLTTRLGRPLGARTLGRGAAAIAAEGHSPTLGLEWPPAPGGQAAGGLET